jgi:hypothetical protein
MADREQIFERAGLPVPDGPPPTVASLLQKARGGGSSDPRRPLTKARSRRSSSPPPARRTPATVEPVPDDSLILRRKAAAVDRHAKIVEDALGLLVAKATAEPISTATVDAPPVEVHVTFPDEMVVRPVPTTTTTERGQDGRIVRTLTAPVS